MLQRLLLATNHLFQYSLLIYHDSKGRLRIHHISDKSSLNDTFMNKTIQTKRVSHEKASEAVGKDMGLSEEETEAVSSSINQKEAEVGDEVSNTSQLPHKTLKEKSDEDIDNGVSNGLGGCMGNADAGQTGRKNYSTELNENMKSGKDKKLKKKLDELGVKPDKDGKRGRVKLYIDKINDSHIVDTNYVGELFMYCRHCPNQELKPVSSFTTNTTQKTTYVHNDKKNGQTPLA